MSLTRARALVASLDEGEELSERVSEAFAELDELPPEVVRAELGEWLGPAADPEALDDAVRLAHGMPRRALHLRTIAVVKDADVLDLGAVAEEQLRIAGKSWDGADLESFERLDGEIEGSFAGTLEHRVLVDASDASAKPLYDVLLHESGGASGVVFHAGTTRVAAMISDGIVEARDRRVRAALEACLAPAANDVLETIEAPIVDDVPLAEPVTAKRPAGKKRAASKKSSASAEGAPAKATTKRAAAKTTAKTASTNASATAKRPPGKKRATTKRASAKKSTETE